MEKSPFELCQISGFGFRRVDAIVQKSGGDLHDPMRIKGAVFCALDEGKSKRGHLYISSEELEKSALKLLNEKIPVPELRLHQQEVRDMMQEMILNGAIVSVKDNIYLPRVFAQEDETARRIAQRLVAQMPVEHIAPVLEQVKVEMGLRLSAQQEAAVYAAFRHGLSVITGSPGTGKTTVLRTILEVYRRLHPDGKIALMAPTGRASRRMSESTGFEDARTLHSGLGLTSEEDEGSRNRKSEPLSADLIIVDEFSMVDMWLAEKFFERMKAIPKSEIVNARYREKMEERKNLLRSIRVDYTKAADELDMLKAEVIKALRGESTFSKDLLGSMVSEAEAKCTELQKQFEDAQAAYEEGQTVLHSLEEQYDNVISWADLYDTASLEAKKMIVNCLIRRVEVYRDYKLHIDFNIDFAQFSLGLDIVEIAA